MTSKPTRGGVPFLGMWDPDTLYRRTSVVLRGGALYEAVVDNRRDPATGGPSWIDLTAFVIHLYGSIDPTTQPGIPAALGSTYRQSGVGLLTKTGEGTTDWMVGGASISATSVARRVRRYRWPETPIAHATHPTGTRG